MTVREDGTTLIYDLVLNRTRMDCPYCNEPMISWGHNRPKLIKISSLREYNGIIRYSSNRYLCKSCGHTASERNPFSYDRFRSSYQLIRSVFRYLGNLNYTLDMISKEPNISSTQINTYIDSYIVIPHRDLPEWLGIDELHNPELSYKNSSYLCVLVDGKNRCIYDVLGSRSKSYLNNFFDTFSLSQRKRVKYVTIDLWRAYKDVALRCFPDCIIAADPFHYCKHLCDGFDRLRISVMKQCEYGSNRYYLLKKWNWLLTKENVDLDNDSVYNSRFKAKLNRREILNMILDEFPILNEAYYLKERFLYAVATYDHDTMKAKYDAFVKMFKDSDIKEYDEFTSELETWKSEILNSFLRPYGSHKLSNALTENINGKLGTYLSVSHGIANMNRFRKRVLFALNKDIFYSSSSVLNSCALPGKKRGPYKKIKE